MSIRSRGTFFRRGWRPEKKCEKGDKSEGETKGPHREGAGGV